jgi:hypothetical protein
MVPNDEMTSARLRWDGPSTQDGKIADLDTPLNQVQ